ncbi:MAG: hypothetical protein AB7E55_32720 [Pigmentiphaga sp.]
MATEIIVALISASALILCAVLGRVFGKAEARRAAAPNIPQTDTAGNPLAFNIQHTHAVVGELAAGMNDALARLHRIESNQQSIQRGIDESNRRLERIDDRLIAIIRKD